MKKAVSVAVCLLMLAALVPLGCVSQPSLGMVRVAVYPGSEQEALGQLTRLMLEDRGYAVELVENDSLIKAHAALSAGEADLLWAYGWDIWHLVLKHDITCGDAEVMLQRITAEDAANGIAWVGAAPCLRFGSVAVRRSDAKLEKVQSISDLVTHLLYQDPALSLCNPSPRSEQPGAVEAMMRYYGLGLRSEKVFNDSYEGCLERVAGEACTAAYALSNDPALVQLDLRLLEDDRHSFQRSYLSFGFSQAALRRYPDAERIVKELAAALSCQTLIDVQLEAESPRTTMATAAKELLEEKRMIGSRRRRPTRAWE
jgi:osmoprotectant transport system substrate-binding protein